MDIFVGFIAAFGFNFAPRNWAMCAGQLVAISDNTAMYSLLSDFYGGDGRSTFGIPEMRGRSAVGYGNGPGLNPVGIGVKAGSERHLIQIADLPFHTHAVTVEAGGGGGGAVGVPSGVRVSQTIASKSRPDEGDYLGDGTIGTTLKDAVMYVPAGSEGTTVKLGGVTGEPGSAGALPKVSLTGAGSTNSSISLASPFIAINYSIVTIGLYPSRN